MIVLARQQPWKFKGRNYSTVAKVQVAGPNNNWIGRIRNAGGINTQVVTLSADM